MSDGELALEILRQVAADILEIDKDYHGNPVDMFLIDTSWETFSPAAAGLLRRLITEAREDDK